MTQEVPQATKEDVTPTVVLAEEPDIAGTAAEFEPLADDGGFARSAAATTAWAKIGQTIDADMPHARGLDAPVKLSFQRIEKGFQFRAMPGDEDFVFLHVEPLLDQAADLLDRGIRERMQWDDLAARAATLALELAEYKALDAIHAEEEKAGYYNNEFYASQGEVNAAAASKSMLDQAKGYQIDVTNKIQGDYNAAYNASRKSAWLSGLVAYSFGDAPFKGYVKHNYGGVENTVADHSLDAADTLSEYNFYQAYYASIAQRLSTAAATDSIAAKQPYSAVINQWNSKNVAFRKRRTIAARNIQDVKARAATDQDGLLNYEKRLPAIRNRFQADFRNALARLQAAQVGLEQLFGYTEPLPADTASIAYFDDCLNWTREAIHWLIRYARREQSTVVTVSLRERVGANWTDALLNGEFSVDLAEEVFGDCRGVRLRGISMHVVRAATATPPARLLRTRVQVPPSGMVRRLDGSVINLDQATLPQCRFGRVTDRESMRMPDVFGAATLHNASPIGTWTFWCDGFVGQGGVIADIDDIEVDIHIGFRVS